MDQRSLQNFLVFITNSAMQWFKVFWWLSNNLKECFLNLKECFFNLKECFLNLKECFPTWKSVFSSRFLPAPVPVGQISEETVVPSVSDVKASGVIWTALVLEQKWRTRYANNVVSINRVLRHVSVTDKMVVVKKYWVTTLSMKKKISVVKKRKILRF